MVICCLFLLWVYIWNCEYLACFCGFFFFHVQWLGKTYSNWILCFIEILLWVMFISSFSHNIFIYELVVNYKMNKQTKFNGVICQWGSLVLNYVLGYNHKVRVLFCMFFEMHMVNLPNLRFVCWCQVCNFFLLHELC